MKLLRKKIRFPKRFASRTLRLLFVLSFLANQVHAQILVTNDNSSGSGSLSNALTLAAGTPNSLIQFDVDGNITLGSDLTVSNSPTINAGGSSALAIPDNISLTGPLTMNMSGAAGTISGVIYDGSSPGSLSVVDTVGGGILDLTGSNTYSGGTTIGTNAKVGVNSGSSLGTGTLTFNGGTLQTQAAGTFSNAVAMTGAGTLDLDGFSSTFSGPVTGAGLLTVSNSAGTAAILTLSGANSYTGGTKINANAEVGINDNAGLGTGMLTFNGGALQTQAALTNFSNSVYLFGNGTVDLDGNSSTLSGSITGYGALTVANSVSGTPGILTINGVNTFSGGTTINTAAEVGITNIGALGSGGLVFNGGSLQIQQALSGPFTNTFTMTGAGTVDLDGNAVAISGAINGSGALTVTDTSAGGGGALTMSGSNDATGGLDITAGSGAGGVTVLAGATNALGSGALTMTGGGASANLTLQGYSQRVGSLAGDSASTIDLDGGTLSVGGNGQSTSYEGLIKDTAGTGSLTMIGAGTLLLTGVNTYAGGTNLDAGIVSIANVGSLGTGGLTFNGGTLQTQQALTGFANTIALAGAGTIDLDGNSSTFTGGVTGAGALSVSNSVSGGVLTLNGAVLALNGANAYTGGTTINAGAELGINNNGGLGTGALTFSGGALQTQAALSFGNAVTLAGAGTVDLDGAASTFSGNVTGAGALTVTDTSVGGGGALTLSGTNANTGGLNITAYSGTGAGPVSVLAGAAGALGTGALAMTGGSSQANLNLQGYAQTVASLSGDAASTLDLDGAALSVGGNSQSTAFAGLIKDTAGTGVLTMAGAGTLLLSGANTYAGGTDLNAGTIAVANNAALGTGAVTFGGGALQTQQALTNFSNAVVLTAAGTVDLDGNASTFSGNLSGAGALTITDSSLAGGGALTLSGTNANTGAVNITAGAGSSGVSVLADAAGALGSGRVTMTGGTSLANLNLEGFAETIGSLRGDAASTLDLDGATLTMGGDGTSTAFAGTLMDSAGTGSLIKNGNGTFVLSGSWNNAATQVNAGTFQLGANTGYNGSLSVNSGATFDLNGFNQTGTGAIVNAGTIKTGAGVLSAASYNGPSATLSVALQPSAASLNVTGGGSANVTNGTLAVTNHPAPGAYTVINAGTISGQFSTITLSPDFKETAAYSGGKLTLDLVPTLASGVQSANQRAVGSALFNLSAAAAGDLRTALNQLDALPSAQANAALDEIGPQAMVAMGAMLFSASSLQASAVSRHLADLPVGGAYTADGERNPYPGTLIAAGGVGDTPEPWHDATAPKDNGEYFGSATGSQGRIDPAAGASGAQPGFRFTSEGATVGANTPGNGDLVLGFALGYVGSAADVDSANGTVDGQSLRGGVFAARRLGDLHGNLYVGGAFDTFSVSRNISALGRDATSTPSGSEIDAAGQAVYDLHLSRLTFSPMIGFGSDQLTIAPVKESGAGAMDLSIAQQDVYSLRSDAGARVSYRFGGDLRSLTPYASASFEHEFMNQSRNIDAAFVSGGSPFTITTADISRSGMLLTAGLSMDWRSGAGAQLEYAKDTRSNYNVNTLILNARARF